MRPDVGTIKYRPLTSENCRRESGLTKEELMMDITDDDFANHGFRIAAPYQSGSKFSFYAVKNGFRHFVEFIDSSDGTYINIEPQITVGGMRPCYSCDLKNVNSFDDLMKQYKASLIKTLDRFSWQLNDLERLTECLL